MKKWLCVFLFFSLIGCHNGKKKDDYEEVNPNKPKKGMVKTYRTRLRIYTKYKNVEEKVDFGKLFGNLGGNNPILRESYWNARFERAKIQNNYRILFNHFRNQMAYVVTAWEGSPREGEAKVRSLLHSFREFCRMKGILKEYEEYDQGLKSER